MKSQLWFDGMEPVPTNKSNPWKPVLSTLARVKKYFEGFVTFSRAIYAKRKHIAERLAMGERTLSRYIAYLVSEGWMATIQRTARTAIRVVKGPVNAGRGTPAGTPKETKPETLKELRKSQCSSVLETSREQKQRPARKVQQVEIHGEYARRFCGSLVGCGLPEGIPAYKPVLGAAQASGKAPEHAAAVFSSLFRAERLRRASLAYLMAAFRGELAA